MPCCEECNSMAPSSNKPDTRVAECAQSTQNGITLYREIGQIVNFKWELTDSAGW